MSTPVASWGTGSNDLRLQSNGAVCAHNEDGTPCPRCAIGELFDSAPAFMPVSLHNDDIEQCVCRLGNDQRDVLMENPETIMLAGGFIRSVITGEDIRDIDIFVDNEASAVRIAEIFRSWLENPRFVKTLTAITIAGNPPTQFIYRFPFQNPSDVLARFDFTISQAAIWFGLDRKWRGMCGRSYYQDLAARRLVYTCPDRDDQDVRVIGRVLKHIDIGYTIDRLALCRLMAIVVRNVARKRTPAELLDSEAMEKIFVAEVLKSSVSPDFAAFCHLSTENRKGAFLPKPAPKAPAYQDWGS